MPTPTAPKNMTLSTPVPQALSVVQNVADAVAAQPKGNGDEPPRPSISDVLIQDHTMRSKEFYTNISAFISGNDLRRAEIMFAKERENNTEIRIHTYNEMIRAYAAKVPCMPRA